MATKRRLLVAAALAACMINAAQRCPGQQVNGTAQEHAARANEALRSGHPDKAIPEFQALIALEPGNVDAQANLGVLLYFQGDFKAAVTPLRTAVQLNPNLPKIRALLGLAEATLGDAGAAKTDLNTALTALGDAPNEAKLRKQVVLKLVEIGTAHDDQAGAAASLASLHAIASDDPEVLYASYRVYSDLAAESLLNLSLAAPKSGRMQQAIAHELERVRDYPGAIASFRRAIAAEPQLPGVHFELAEVLRVSDSQADKAAAESEYELALKQNPADALSAARLGDLHADRNDLTGAHSYYEQALKSQPENTDALIGLAHVESELGADAKALALLQSAIAADPGNVLAHFRLSALYRKMHKPEDAKNELDQYQKLRQVKENLKQVYSTMKLQAPASTQDAPPEENSVAGKKGTP